MGVAMPFVLVTGLEKVCDIANGAVSFSGNEIGASGMDNSKLNAILS